MGDLAWREHRSHRTAWHHGAQVGMVSRTADGWHAVYWWDLEDLRRSPNRAVADRRSLIGTFPGVDEAVAAVEERHQGRDACE